MRRIIFSILFVIWASVGFAQTEATTISLATAAGSSTTWDGEVNIYRDSGGNLVFEDLNTGPVELRDLMTGTGTTTFTTAAGSTITLTERLGVGTTTPTEVVEIVGREDDDVSLLIQNTALSSYSQAALSVKNGTAIGALAAFHPNYDNGDKPGWEDSVDVYISTSTASLGFAAPGVVSFIRFMTGGVDWSLHERMRIDADGLVGIGTSAPIYGVDLLGSTSAEGTIRAGYNTSGSTGGSVVAYCDTTDTNWTSPITAGYFRFHCKDSSGTLYTVARIQGEITDRTAGSLDSNIAFYTYDDNASAPRMTIKESKVGIGTAAPSTALEVSGTVTATAFAGDGSALTGVSAAGVSRWYTISTGHYTGTPTSTSELAMSDTSEVAKARPLRYTIGGTAYYGIVADITASTSITVSGAPLSGAVTKLEVGQAEQVIPLTFFVAGYYADATEADLLASDLNYFHHWQQGAARLVAIRAVHSADDATTAPLAEITIGGTASILTQSVTTVFPTITTPIVSVNTSTYDVQPGEAIEVKSTKNGTGDAENLSITGLFVLE